METNEQPKSLADNLAGVPNYIPNKANAPPLEQQKEQFDKLKKKLDELSKKITKKFSFTQVIALLPANASQIFEEDENLSKEVVKTKPLHLIMIIPEEQYKNLNKIKTEIVSLVKETGENFWVHIKTSEVDLWNYGLDSKYEFLDAISASFPIYDKGILGALRVANIHKSLCLNWLNTGRVQYVASYVIGGSLVRGTADQTSDVDTFIIIDDTDVKRMSRLELLEKLRRRITYDFIKEATALAGVKNILNVQVYLLTDFWQSVKDAQPVMFTFIRDGIPLFDKGTFTPWKRLLQMGRIKPSPEAIDLYMKEGDRTDEIVKRRLIDSMIDVYFGVITPTQAMMMLAGNAPPVPKTIVQEVKEKLVEKEKLLSSKELKTLEKVVQLYKDYEHGKLKEISGKEVDELLKEGREYAKRMKELRTKLEKRMQEHQAEEICQETFSLIKNIFGNKGQDALIKEIDSELIKTGKIPERMLSIAKEISKLKRRVKDKKFTQSEMQRIKRDASDLISCLTEFSQRKDLISLEKGIVRITHKEQKMDVVLTEKQTFISDGIKIRKIENGKLVNSNKEELEKALRGGTRKMTQTLPSEILDVLKKEFGEFTINL